MTAVYCLSSTGYPPGANTGNICVTNFYSDKALATLGDECTGLTERCMQLQERCLNHNFQSERAREFARHGLARRLCVLVRCILNVFGVIPPEFDGLPTTDELQDAEIQLQAFLINVFGCLDNLAWIWVKERDVKNPKNGKALGTGAVGLRPKNEVVMDSLDADLRAYLESMEDWFQYLENYRHALAHQIPLYIPPFGPRPGCEDRYLELETEITERTLRGDLAELDSLRRERSEQTVFRPYIMGSFTDGTQPMPFHWQIICDFKTIEAISAKMLDALALLIHQ